MAWRWNEGADGDQAGCFAGKVRAGQVQPLLESLAELALVRHVPELEAYAL